MRSTSGALLDEIRSAGLPEGLGAAVEAFKAQFRPSEGSVAAADPTAADAAEVGEAESHKTLATE